MRMLCEAANGDGCDVDRIVLQRSMFRRMLFEDGLRINSNVKITEFLR